MKLRTAILAVGALLLVACSNDMNADQYTFACDEDTPCAEGFFCGPNGVCVEDGTDVSPDDDTTDTTQDAEDAEDADDADDADDARQDVEEDVADADDTDDTSDATDTEDTADTSDAADASDTCEAQTWYRDCDDDGFPSTTTEACDRPETIGGDCPIDGGVPVQRWKSASEIDNAGTEDCDDNDPRAFPGQTEFFETPREEVGGFDFDCDNEETPRYPDVSTGCEEAGTCELLNTSCNPTPGVVGWQNSLANCGEDRPWVNGCSDECVSSCNEARITVDRTQSCN